MLKNILIIGGTSGLGLELAKRYEALGHNINITGRKDPGIPGLKYFPLAISSDAQKLIHQVDDLVSKIDTINTLIYVAGYYQEGCIDKLNDEQILEMINVGLTAPSLLIRRLKNNPGKPLKIILITSSSQYTPREFEPMYTAVKSGLGMLGESLSLDASIGKVLVAAPMGMKTSFWNNTDKDTSEMLDPEWVAEQIIELSSGPYKYRYAKINRNPQRVEVIKSARSNMDIQETYKEYKIPPNLQQHMTTVAKIGEIIAKNFIGTIDSAKIKKAALLHDIGNIVKFDIEKYPDFLGEEADRKDYWLDVQKAMITKYGNDDHEATRKMLAELKMDNAIVEMILSKSYNNAIKIKDGDYWELKILLYADLRVGPFGILPLGERLEEVHERLDKYRNRMDLFAAAMEIEKQLQERVRIDLSNIDDKLTDAYAMDMRVDL